MKLSIIMPVYNEIATIAEIIRRVRKSPIDGSKELILVDDCSTDGTREYLQNLVSHKGLEGAEVKIIFHEQNLGKGSAIRTAIPHVTGTIVLIQDADFEYDPRDYAAHIDPILDGRADVV